MHRRPGKVRGGSWRGWLGLLRERPPTRHAPLCPDVRGLQHHPGPGSRGPSACRERGHRGGGAGGRRRGGGAPQDSRCERALRPQARGGGGGDGGVGGSDCVCGRCSQLWAVQPAVSGEPGGLPSSQTTHSHHFSKAPQLKGHCRGSPAAPAPADRIPVGAGPCLPLATAHGGVSGLSFSHTLDGPGEGRAHGLPSAPGLRGGVPVPHLSSSCLRGPLRLMPTVQGLQGPWGLGSCSLQGGHTQSAPP